MVTLEYAVHTHIGFDDSSYRWISVKKFTWSGAADDTAILAALIGHPRFRDTFLSADSHELDAGDIHGPYHLDAITPADFRPTGSPGVAALVEEFCGLYDAPPRSEVRERIEAEVLSPLSGASCFRLRELPDAVHDFGWVLWEFRELAAICRSPRIVLSVVMAID
jgi:hypothetical protein